MFTVLIRACWLSPLRHILFLFKFSYRHAITSCLRTKSVSVLSSVAHFVKNFKKITSQVIKNGPPTPKISSPKLPKAPKSSPRDPRTPLRVARPLPIALGSAPEGAQPSLSRARASSPAPQKPMFSLRKTLISHFGALPAPSRAKPRRTTPPADTLGLTGAASPRPLASTLVFP